MKIMIYYAKYAKNRLFLKDLALQKHAQSALQSLEIDIYYHRHTFVNISLL